MSVSEISVLQAFLLAISVSLFNAAIAVLIEDVVVGCGFISASLLVFLLALFVARDSTNRDTSDD
jgi:hypothetical protein